MNDDVTDEEIGQLWCNSDRDPRIVRSISEVAADAELRSPALPADRPQPRTAALLSDAEIESLDEYDLEGLWPRGGERRVVQLGRGIPQGCSITPQHLPRMASAPTRSI